MIMHSNIVNKTHKVYKDKTVTDINMYIFHNQSPVSFVEMCNNYLKFKNLL